MGKLTNRAKEDREMGVLQWFHVGEYEKVETTIDLLRKLGIKRLRTGVSWADFHTSGGQEWYQWLLPKLSQHFELLPCFLYTPPSIGIVYKTSAPPKGPKKFADFLDHVIREFGEHFQWVELWNEPNNRSEYDYTLDANWEIFCEMITCAAYWAKHLGKKVALGGMSPIDCNWLDYMAKQGILEHVDAVGVHGFPDTFDSHFLPWDMQIDAIRQLLKDHKLKAEVWITEVGYSTWNHDEKKQVTTFLDAYYSSADRVYWYSLIDLDPQKATVDGFHLDEREYYFGLVATNCRPKLLFRLLECYSPKEINELSWLHYQEDREGKGLDDYYLITGGAGFIGCNMADRLLEKGEKVLVFDNLSRPVVEKNLEWLFHKHGQSGRLAYQWGDIRNYQSVRAAMEGAKIVFHFCAQVAVTTSLEEPEYDLDVNARGTLNVLEAIRKSKRETGLVFTSTNKVYGDLARFEFKEGSSSYVPVDPNMAKNGIDESCPLDFHSPYGCSKGTADQYVLDYVNSYGIKAAVFRMSCIYGPRQFGTEDQGWVAHFILSVLKDKTINLYGNGKQVRDILYITDLVSAFEKVVDDLDSLSGNVFNIGGGPENSTSLLELIEALRLDLDREEIPFILHQTRQGDQLYYVSNIQKIKELTGWEPKISKHTGVRKLVQWLQAFLPKNNLSEHKNNNNGIQYPKKTATGISTGN